jgi:L-ribulokinase
MLMQIYADVTGREMKISRSAQTCALGAAISGAVVAGKAAGGYDDFASAQSTMCGVKDTTYKPKPQNQKVYQRLYELYKVLHDAFGQESWTGRLSHVMKELLKIKDQANII